MGCRVQRHLVNVAEDDNILVRVRPTRFVATRTAAASGHESEFAQTGVGATAARDERDVELVIEVLPAQQSGGGGDHAGG